MNLKYNHVCEPGINPSHDMSDMLLLDSLQTNLRISELHPFSVIWDADSQTAILKEYLH